MYQGFLSALLVLLFDMNKKNLFCYEKRSLIEIKDLLSSFRIRHLRELAPCPCGWLSRYQRARPSTSLDKSVQLIALIEFNLNHRVVARLLNCWLFIQELKVKVKWEFCEVQAKVLTFASQPVFAHRTPNLGDCFEVVK
jgi:hypothetical protein